MTRYARSKTTQRRSVKGRGSITQTDLKQSRPPKLKSMRQRRLSLLLNGITRKNRVPKVLAVACRDPTRCIALGQYRDMINHLFQNFTAFDSVDSNKMTRIGNDSWNGFVVKIPFEKNGYTAYTILKSSANTQSDNLVYEYLVGTKFINPQGIRFPCFLETYSLNRYAHMGYHSAMKNIAREFESSLYPSFVPCVKDMIHPVSKPVDWATVCSDSMSFSILVQYFDNIETYNDLVLNLTHKSDILPVLYQIYYALDTLKDVYTHNDLHRDNVLLYKPFAGDVYMKMHYHQPNGTVVTMHCDRIAKIIDYGRNYFKTDTTSTKIIMGIVKSLDECVRGKNMDSVINRPPKANGTADMMLVSHDITWLNGHSIRINPNTLNFAPIASDPASGMVNNVTDMRTALERPEIQNYFQSPKYENWTCGGRHAYLPGWTTIHHSITCNPRCTSTFPGRESFLCDTCCDVEPGHDTTQNRPIATWPAPGPSNDVDIGSSK